MQQPIGVDYDRYHDHAGDRKPLWQRQSPVFQAVSILAPLEGQMLVGGFEMDGGDVGLRIGDTVVVVRGTITVLDDFRSDAAIRRASGSLSTARTSLHTLQGSVVAERQREVPRYTPPVKEQRKTIVIGDADDTAPLLSAELPEEEPLPAFMEGYEATGGLDKQSADRHTRADEVEWEK